MGFRRFVKMHKLTNPQQLLMKRRAPYKPLTAERVEMRGKRRLDEYEKKQEDGVIFVAEEALPPWRRTIGRNKLAAQGAILNMRGLRVRGVDKQDEPGFPTHFR